MPVVQLAFKLALSLEFNFQINDDGTKLHCRVLHSYVATCKYL